MGYKKEVIKGISWLGALRIFARGLTFLKTLVLARILSPYQFGIYGIASLVLSLLEILTETGINIFLVQRSDSIDKYINTAWIVSIGRGVVISLIIFASSFFVADFFNSPNVLPLLILISLVPLIRGFMNPSVASFQKDLKFHKEFYYRSSIFLIETVVSIIFVIILRDPISLVYGLISGAIFEVIISFVFIKPVPAFKFNRKIFSDIISHGKWITGAGTFAYLFHNGDNVVVGKMLGATSLGIYDMAYSISFLPISEISDIVMRVTFPVFSRISNDKKRLKKAYIKTTLLIMVLVFPLALIFILFPYQLILLLLGEQWLGGVDILRILAATTILISISSPSSAVFYALKKQKIVTFITAVGFIAMVATIVPLIYRFGLVGAALSVMIASMCTVIVSIHFLVRELRYN